MAAACWSQHSPEDTAVQSPPLTYKWVGELANAADLVVMVEVEELVPTLRMEVETSKDTMPKSTIFYRVEVTDVLKGEIYAGVEIVVGRVAPGEFHGIPITSLNLSEHLVLFLQERSSVNLPLELAANKFYTPVNFDYAVFDVTEQGRLGPSYADETIIHARTSFYEGHFWNLRQLRKLVADSAGMQQEDYIGRITFR